MEVYHDAVSVSVLGRRSFLGTVACGFLFALVGCNTTGAFLEMNGPPPSCEPPCQVQAFWQPNVMFAADPTRNGVQAPGLAGRVYLFGPEIKFPLVGDGALEVALYDNTPRPDSTGPVLIEQWKIDPETLKRLLKEDYIGWGYTVFLPWGTYKPDITRVQVKVRYVQSKGAPLYTESRLLTIAGAGENLPPTLVQHAAKPRSAQP